MLLHEPFDFHAGSRADYEFARCEDQEISYGEAKVRSDRLAAVLSGCGLVKGDRFAILMRNHIDILLLMFAASRLGLVTVPLNFRLGPQEWSNILTDSGARLIIADPAFAADVDTAILGEGTQLICAGTPPLGWLSLETLIETTRPDVPKVEVAPEDILLLVYTSGTTGRAKGALLSQRAIVSNIFQINLATPYKLSPGERALIVLPLFHVAAVAAALGAVCGGACLVIHRDVDPMAIARSLSEEEIVVASLVPAVIQFLLVGIPGLSEMSFPKLAFLGYGASPIAEPVLRRALEVFKCRVAQGYGMTELAGACSMLTEADHRKALAGRSDLLLSAGKALPGCQVRIVGPNDEDLLPGKTGEIIVRGEQLMSGYWKMPEATAEALGGGWLHTGDAGYLDEEGYLFIRDRIKDMIVSGAENIYPAEIESVLHDHPAVAEVAVIGVPDEKWGETVMAVVVRKPDILVTADEFDAYCRSRLGGFKVPRRYEFVGTLPRNASGKVLKRELREQYWQGHARRVS